MCGTPLLKYFISSDASGIEPCSFPWNPCSLFLPVLAAQGKWKSLRSTGRVTYCLAIQNQGRNGKSLLPFCPIWDAFSPFWRAEDAVCSCWSFWGNLLCLLLVFLAFSAVRLLLSCFGPLGDLIPGLLEQFQVVLSDPGVQGSCCLLSPQPVTCLMCPGERPLPRML